MTASIHFLTGSERTAAAEPADFDAIAQGAGIPTAGRIRHWFEQGWCAATRSDVLMRGGTDDALVRYALRSSHAEANDRPARRAFAKGVRAKLTDYRARGLI